MHMYITYTNNQLIYVNNNSDLGKTAHVII